MWRCALLILLAAGGLLAQTPRHISVQQLRQVLAWQTVTGVHDDKAAAQLQSLELDERLTSLTMNRLRTEFHPGRQTSAALNLLADMSAFLAPPRAEMPRRDAPEPAEQEKIIQSARNIAGSTLHHLPDFLATRTTRRFEDVPVIMARRSYQSGLHLSGTFERETAFREGHEVNPEAPLAPVAAASRETSRDSLSSIGEFGQVLAIIMADSASGTVAWSHWEDTAAGMVAVFHYQVPKSGSHYKVHFCCEWSREMHSDSYDGMPAYHGALSIDPSSGAVLRLTLIVDFEGFDPPPRYALAVSYAPIEIGGKSAILPVRSAVIGEEITPQKKRDLINLYVNAVDFTSYRRFGSTVKVIPSAQTH